MNKIYFSRTRDVKAPTRGTSLASGIDLYVPSFDKQFIDDLALKNPDISNVKPDCFEYVIINVPERKEILLAPGARICIPSGIKFRGIKEISFNMHNKSGVATKKGLVYGAEVVDCDYQGEVHISLINTSNYIVSIKEGEKIVQLLAEPVDLSELEELSEEHLFDDMTSERGEGWQGSTGTE